MKVGSFEELNKALEMKSESIEIPSDDFFRIIESFLESGKLTALGVVIFTISNKLLGGLPAIIGALGGATTYLPDSLGVVKELKYQNMKFLFFNYEADRESKILTIKKD